jgi:dTDP-4-dehydrorhamnose 3,5-epimerase
MVARKRPLEELVAMFFEETNLSGSFIITPELKEDERGYFARTFCRTEFKQLNLSVDFVQHSVSYNRKAYTLRGMHFQKAPHEETKLVCCTRGAIYDVIVDLRPHSPTYKNWLAVELDSRNKKSLYIPKGFAHGFETLEDDSEVSYMIDQYYVPESSGGFKYDDTSLLIDWPFSPCLLSENDQNLPPFSDEFIAAF